MPGTFSSFNTALTSLRYNSVVLQNASNNLANANNDGYVRRRVVGAEVGGPDQPAMYARYDGIGEGVQVTGTQRMVDPLLDARLRREHTTQSYLDTKAAVLDRVEAGIGEPGDKGVSAALLDFKQSWQDLANNPGSEAARAQVISRGAILADSLAVQSRSISAEEADQRVKATGLVSQVNGAAEQLAQLNRDIYATDVNGVDNNSLKDSRDQLALRLAELTGGQVVTGAGGMMNVVVGAGGGNPGVALVDGGTAHELVVTSGITTSGDSDGAPLAFGVDTGSGVAAVTGRLGGALGATADLLTTTLPAYRQSLDAIASAYADAVNAGHRAGYDLAGAAGGDFFTYDPANPAASLAVAFSDPAAVAASSVAGQGFGDGNAHAMTDVGQAVPAYQKLVNGFGTDVAAVKRQAANQLAMTSQVDGVWESQAGVNLDEETVTMVTAQRSYEAASKLMSVLDSVLDTLINRTGLTR